MQGRRRRTITNSLATAASRTGTRAHPSGTVAHNFTESLPEPVRFKAEGSGDQPPLARPTTGVDVQIHKPAVKHIRHRADC